MDRHCTQRTSKDYTRIVITHDPSDHDLDYPVTVRNKISMCCSCDRWTFQEYRIGYANDWCTSEFV